MAFPIKESAIIGLTDGNVRLRRAATTLRIPLGNKGIDKFKPFCVRSP